MTLRFDRFVLDVPARRLLRDGADVHLTPKAFELLQLLIERRPAACSKTVIMETLWPDTFVLEANVANLVAEVRAALGAAEDGDDARQRFVRTVPRFGYAFAGEIPAAVAATPTIASAPPLPGSPLYALSPFALLSGPRRLALPEGTTILGREGTAAELLASPTVSRRHARIDVAGDEVYLEDLNSKNGCVIDGTRITGRVRIAHGDSISIGSVAVMLVREDGPPTETLLINRL